MNARIGAPHPFAHDRPPPVIALAQIAAPVIRPGRMKKAIARETSPERRRLLRELQPAPRPDGPRHFQIRDRHG